MLSLTVTDTRDQTAAVFRALAQEMNRAEIDLTRWQALQTWLAKTVKRGPNYTLENVAASALMLREAMTATQQLVQSIDPELKLNELLAEVDSIERIYRAAHEQQVQYWKEFQHPRSRKANAKDAAEIAFSRIMSGYMKKTFGQYLDSIVAALTQATFGRAAGEKPFVEVDFENAAAAL